MLRNVCELRDHIRIRHLNTERYCKRMRQVYMQACTFRNHKSCQKAKARTEPRLQAVEIYSHASASASYFISALIRTPDVYVIFHYFGIKLHWDNLVNFYSRT